MCPAKLDYRSSMWLWKMEREVSVTSDTNLLGLLGLVCRQVGQLSKAQPERDRARAEPARARVGGSRTVKAPSPGAWGLVWGWGGEGPDRPLEEAEACPWGSES